MIDHDFLNIEYFGKLPMIVYTERGWLIESDQYANELINEWRDWLSEGKETPEMAYLKDRNRQMILLMLEKIKESGNQAFIPYLKLWEEIEYQKVRTEIRETIGILELQNPVDNQAALQRQDKIKEALKGSPASDYLVKCFECGKRFTFTVEEQKFFKQEGLSCRKDARNAGIRVVFGKPKRQLKSQ
ncbi:zinc-ribbon domain-containing protein [Bacillus salacetis]|uniref:zinc-ribbon domain-containing protein n=1 Tax=Bacillus salacetis TaxID=2315464 RepID=UPI001F0C04B3|nr:zinc-ribbon domain-containing protein [Bacillus salacetis]